jgi:hypothetical protein
METRLPSKVYNLIVLIPLGVVFLVLYALALVLEPIDGDLTRTGPYLESEFGWNQPQDKFEKDLYSIAKDKVYEKYHDVVVVGDSFSTMEFTYQWQNYLYMLTGWSNITFNSNFTNVEQLIDSEGFKKNPPRLFIWQFVERGIVLAPTPHQDNCPSPGSKPDREYSIKPVPVKVVPFVRDKTIDFFQPNFNESSYYLKYFLRSLFISSMNKHSRVVRLPLKKGNLFSSKNDREILLFNRDLWKAKRYKEELVVNRQCVIRRLQNKVQSNGKTHFIVLVAPDKTSTYATYIDFQKFQNINLFEKIVSDPQLPIPRVDLAFQKNIEAGMKDVYPPNETHWGSRGHRIVAETVIQFLKEHGALKSP